MDNGNYMSTEQIKISVIVLIYNMEKLLPRCLQSLERQTMKGIQFVLVDDGSTDGSPEICDSWKPEGHHVKIIHKKNENVVAGWMDGVNAADGDYVGFVDSDDYIDDDMYENLWKAVEQSNVDISMCNHLYEKNGKMTICKSILHEGIYEGTQMNALRVLVMPKLAEPYLSPSLCNKILRKDLFKRNFQFCDKQVTIADDVSVVLPCLYGAKSFSYIDKPYYHYVTRDDGVTHTYRENMYYQHEQLLNNLELAINFYKPELPDEAFAMLVSAMGNQWLRMIANTKLSNNKRKELLRKFYSDQRYVLAAQKMDEVPANKWVKAYCDVILRHKYWKYSMMIRLLNCRNKLKV